jgi:hypothetical protein
LIEFGKLSKKFQEKLLEKISLSSSTDGFDGIYIDPIKAISYLQKT